MAPYPAASKRAARINRKASRQDRGLAFGSTSTALGFSVNATISTDGDFREGEPPYRPASDGTAASAKRPWLTRRRLVIAAVSLPLLALVWWFSAYPRGMIVALANCTFGHYEIQTFGYPAPWLSEYRRLTSERYDVKVRVVAGCVVTEELVQYVRGYNCVSRGLIETRFGKDVIAECAEDAEAAWKRAHPNE